MTSFSDSGVAQSVVQPGERITILSIDGGGIRGVIAVRILQFLEQELQAIDGPGARLADYFDVVAGTSTGGLIAGMLTAPDEQGRPRFTANDGMKFYKDDAKSIFVQRPSIIKLLLSLIGPRYSPDSLDRILRDNFQDIRMSDTVTELLVPTFDIKIMEPTVFSSSEAKTDASTNAYLRDVLSATSAAPTYFPPKFVQTTDSAGKSRDYNLVDGGVAMNNPTYSAIMHVLQEKYGESSNLKKPMNLQHDFHKLLVISLGTGTTAVSYNAKDASSWGIFSWILHSGKSPILNIISEGSADVVNLNTSVLFQTLECPQNYLRIQALNLLGQVTSIDDSTNKNVESLINIGDKLLDEVVTRLDINTHRYTPQHDQETNKEALKRFAKELVQERKARETSNPN